MSTTRHTHHPRFTARGGPGAAVAAVAALLLLTSCGQAEEPGASPAPTASPPPAPGGEETEEPDDSTTTEDPVVITPLPDDSDTSAPPFDPVLPTGEVPPEVQERPEVQAAVADLAQRLETAEAEVTVAGHAAVTWSDGSLGCPEPGQMYTQALVPGELLVLESGGRLFSYHAAEGRDFSFCPKPIAPAQVNATM